MNWREILGEEDVAAYRKGGFGRRVGFGLRPGVLVVDMTYLFVDPYYPNAAGPLVDQAVQAFADLLPFARGLGVPIFYSRRGSRRRPAERGVSDLKWGCTADPRWLNDPRADAWPPEIAPGPEDYIIEKAKPSAFFETPLRTLLEWLGVDTLVVGGVSTSGCVRAAVTDAFSCNLRVIVPEECCADRSQLSHAVSLMDMDMKFADVLPLEEVKQGLQAVVADAGQGRGTNS